MYLNIRYISSDKLLPHINTNRLFYLTRKEHFNAAHRVFNPDWSDEKNLQVFGKCANENYHGHNYDIYVTVKGEADSDTGFIMNSKTLGHIVRKYVTDLLDHKNLNKDVPFLTGVIPTTENLAKLVWEQLEPHITECQLHCIKIQETDKTYVEYFG